MKKVFIFGSVSQRNFGDELLIAILAQKCVESGFQVFINTPDVVTRWITTFAKVKRISYFNLLLSKDIRVVLGGGGYLGSPSNDISKWDIRFCLKIFPIYLYSLIKRKRLTCIGVGGSPLPGRIPRYFVRRILKDDGCGFVRDEATRDLLLQLGKDSKVEADLAAYSDTLAPFSYQATKDQQEQVIFHNIAFTDNMLDALDTAFLQKNKVVILKDSPKEFDNSRLIAYLENESIEYEIIDYINPSVTIAELAASTLVFTGKLHVGIVASTLGIPVIAIPNHIKTVRYYEHMGISDLCMSVIQIDKLKDLETLRENAINVLKDKKNINWPTKILQNLI